MVVACDYLHADVCDGLVCCAREGIGHLNIKQISGPAKHNGGACFVGFCRYLSSDLRISGSYNISIRNNRLTV